MAQKTVSIEDVKPGMVVAEEVADPRGNILVRRGVELNEAWIRGMKSRGVTQVTIQYTPPASAAPPAAAPAAAAAAAAPVAAPAARAADPIVGSSIDRAVAEKYRRIETMFERCLDHPIMGPLAEAAKEHARSKLVEEPRS